MKAYLDFVDEFRISSFFDELVPEEYKNEMARLMEETVNAEEELLKTFKTIKNIKNASVEDLAKVKGINISLAENIYNFFNNSLLISSA